MNQLITVNQNNEAITTSLEVPPTIPNNPWPIFAPKSRKQLFGDGLSEESVDIALMDWVMKIYDVLINDGFPREVAFDRIVACTKEEYDLGIILNEDECARFNELSKDLPDEPCYYTMNSEGLTKHPVDPDMYSYSKYLKELLHTFEFEASTISNFVGVFETVHDYLGSNTFDMFKRVDISEAEKRYNSYRLSLRARFEKKEQSK